MKTPINNPVIWLFASIRFGVTLMALILIYASVGSALPQIRGAVELTEMEVFRHWIFTLLISLFTICLVTATLVRIPFKLVNLGVLTVHTGLLLLVGGSLYYFGTKVEGNVLLRTPSIDLISVQGKNTRVIAQFPAKTGESWTNFMPAFGGQVAFSVSEVVPAKDGAPARAAVVFSSGSGEPKTILAERGQLTQTSDDGRLAIRLTADDPATEFYDDEVPALYIASAGGVPRALPVAGLPIFRERYTDEGYVLKDTASRDFPSKRVARTADVLGLNLPTGWLEHWRMPIELDSSALPFDVAVTGYVPYINKFESDVSDGGSELNPAAKLNWSMGKINHDQSLLALRPAQAMGSFGWPIEFKWIESDGERQKLFEPMAGPNELEITVKDAGVTRRVAIQVGQTIQVEGTPYEIKVQDIRPDWPMMTAGFEGASSPMASIDVSNGKQKYNRTVIQRFPQLSQDIDEQGVRHREGPYDPNLEVHFRTCAEGWMTLVAGPGVKPELAVFDIDGRLSRYALEVNKPESVSIAGVVTQMTLKGLYEKGREISVPVIEPIDTRRPNLGARSASAVRLRFKGRGANAGWTESQWCAFSPYPTLEPRTISVRPPGENQDWEVTYSRLARKLNCELLPGNLTVKYFPGKTSVESWWSDFSVVRPGGQVEKASVYTNQTYSTGDWTLFQSGAARDNWSYTILGVGNRNGIIPMVLGCVFITLGCLFAFYVKPVLIRRIALRGKSAKVLATTEAPPPSARHGTTHPERELQNVH